MRCFIFLALLFVSQNLFCQVILDADGSGDTYALITSVLAPGHNPIETPDCGHDDFGDHIDEIFDDELNDFVFRFHIHTASDDDRCINFDRQRNEIKSYDKSPDNLLGVEGETVVYKWKFKLSDGFQSSPNFTHLHQLKTVGGSFTSKPLYSFTTRKGSPDQLELRYSEIDDQITLKKTDLTPFIGTWLEVTETIEYGFGGTYEVVISRVDDGTELFSYANEAIINWREGTEFIRPKWGIYRSLINAQDLRDETVLYANFSVEEVGEVLVEEVETQEQEFTISIDPVSKVLQLSDYPESINSMQVLSISGQKVLEHYIGEHPAFQFNVANLPQGIYIVNLEGSGMRLTAQVVLFN